MRLAYFVVGGLAKPLLISKSSSVSTDVDDSTSKFGTFAYSNSSYQLLASQQSQALLEKALQGWGWQAAQPEMDTLFKGVPIDTMIKNIGDSVPPRVLSALRKHKGTGPESLTEEELNNARKVINGMMEGQVTQLDITVVECKELREKNTQTENVVVADLSRLGSKLAKEKKRILGSQAGIEEAQGNIKSGEGTLKDHQNRCKREVDTLQAQLDLIKLDLDAAHLIVKLTECPKPETLLQTSNRTESLKTCVGSNKLTVSAGRKDIGLQTPTSAAAFQRALAASVGLKQRSALVQLMARQVPARGPELTGYNKSTIAGACTANDLDGVPIKGCEAFGTQTPYYAAMGDPTKCAEKCSESELCKAFHIMGQPPAGLCILLYGKCEASEDNKCFKYEEDFHDFTTYNKGPPPVSVGASQLPEVAPARVTPPTNKQAFKCTMSDPDCGLLNDNMAIFWGEVKDKHDEKYAELVAAKKECKDTEETINEEIALWNALLQERNTELGEATGEQAEATQTQVDKQREQRELKKEFSAVDAKCKHLVGEIMMNLCGLRKVRGELATFSQGSMSPEKIVDCVVTDWSPQECSKSCKGGKQTLVRSVTQTSDLGIKCPPLQMLKKCNEFECPINCVMGEWSKWGRCSKECGGGLQARVRNIETRPDFGGEACPPQTEAQQCNPDSCDEDCVLKPWSKWKPCNKACGGGSQKRVRAVEKSARGAGRCAKPLHSSRYERQPCNTNDCPPDPVCDAKMDIVFVVDSSGSWTEKGYKVLRKFLDGYLTKYKMDKSHVKIGIVEFSKDAHIIQPMTFDRETMLKNMEEKLQYRRGLTDMAQGLLTAEKVLLDGRKDAQSEVIVLTDGKPSFKFATANAAKKLTRNGVRLIFMPIRTYGNSPFLLSWATHPGKENVFRVKAGLAELEERMGEWQTKLLVSTCSQIYSPLLEAARKEEFPY
mmetsp:Transcript_14734/g.36222  ORF Transcript_14734/g.36222 Transcript_14734/m.36222 type:complete len:945 (-) Transcript_14734:148-2982(-)